LFANTAVLVCSTLFFDPTIRPCFSTLLPAQNEPRPLGLGSRQPQRPTGPLRRVPRNSTPAANPGCSVRWGRWSSSHPGRIPRKAIRTLVRTRSNG